MSRVTPHINLLNTFPTHLPNPFIKEFIFSRRSGYSPVMPHQILKDVFGYDNFRPGQVEVVNALLAGEHALAVMPTGSGKSLCFQIPALMKGGLTIVVSPLVALMEDQVAALKLAGVAAETINPHVIVRSMLRHGAESRAVKPACCIWPRNA